MNTAKLLLIFVVGVAVGVVGGGFVGYTVGSSNRAIDRAPTATVLEPQEERERRPPRTERQPEEESPAEEEAVEVAGTPDDEPDAPAPEPEPAAAGVVEEYAIRPNMESDIMWVGYKRLLGQRLSMEGGFANFEGTIVVEDEDPDESYVEVIVDMTSVFSENAILTTVLRSDAFFDVDNHKTARFVSTTIEPAEEGYLVTGNFTLRGVTHGIQFPAVIERRGDKVYVSAEFTIDRKRWDVGYDAYEESVILNEVVISFEIMAEPV